MAGDTLGCHFYPSETIIIISNILVKISSHEVSKKAVFWPFLLIFCLHEVFMLHMLYLEKIFHTLCSIEASTTIILWDIKRGNWLQSMNLKYPINAYINILHGWRAHNALLYTPIDF